MQCSFGILPQRSAHAHHAPCSTSNSKPVLLLPKPLLLPRCSQPSASSSHARDSLCAPCSAHLHPQALPVTHSQLGTQHHLRSHLAPSSSRPSVSTQAAGASAGSPDQGGGHEVGAADVAAKWKMPVYILGWYAFNIIFNILNKSTLNAFTCPWLVSTWQLAASGLFMVVLWVCKLHPVPKIDRAFIVALLPVALFHVIGHVSACLSFSQMAVSFAHIVKSAEPVFSVALSGPLLGQIYPTYVWLSLLPIVSGCAMSAMKEVSFAWNGFNNAMISNLAMVLRNILSKKSLVNYKHVDGINLFGLISIVSLLYCAPAAVAFEGAKWAPAWSAAVEGMGRDKFLQLMALSGLFYHLYNQASYMVLDLGITPVTFSVGNTMKRVAVVVSSVLFFKNPVSVMNWIGSSIAIIGTYMYSRAMDKWTAETKAKKAASQDSN